MGNMARRTLSILAVIGATGCGDPVAVTTAELLEGSWTWVESSGGITGETFTPASTGERRPGPGLLQECKIVRSSRASDRFF